MSPMRPIPVKIHQIFVSMGSSVGEQFMFTDVSSMNSAKKDICFLGYSCRKKWTWKVGCLSITSITFKVL